MASPRVSPSTRVLLTDLSPEECRAALQATAGDLRNRALLYDRALQHTFPVVGSVSAERFAIRRTPQGRNSFPSRIFGVFTPTATGTRITVTPEPSLLVILSAFALGVLVLALAATLLAPLLSGGTPAPALLILLVFLILFVLGLGALLRQLTRDGQAFLLRHLQHTLHARLAE